MEEAPRDWRYASKDQVAIWGHNVEDGSIGLNDMSDLTQRAMISVTLEVPLVPSMVFCPC